MAATATMPNPAAQEVGRLPQTTIGIPAGGPFIRYAKRGWQQGYATSGTAFAATLTNPLPAVPGFLSALVIKIAATGGTGATAPTAAADAPWNVIQSLTFRDPSGQPIYNAIDGYSLYLINLYSGQCGQGGQQDPTKLPSYSAIQTTSGSGAGNFTFKLWVPLEWSSSGYCSLPADNSAETPRLQIVLAASGTVYTTAPATLPTMAVTVQEKFWTQPSNMPDLAPYDVGASAQWFINNGTIAPPSNAYARILDQMVGQFVHTKIYVYRDSNNARQDDFPSSDLSLIVDNYPYRSQELNDDRYDLMFKGFNVTRPTGVIVYTARQSVQEQVSEADDGEEVWVTTGSTKWELAGTWATNANVPATLQIITGMIFPAEVGFPYGNQGA